MLSLNTIISFFTASLLLAAAPGPDILFVLTQSLAYGRKAGIWVAIGNVAGLIFHTVAVAAGLGALISASPLAYDIMKYIGASYLVYLAYKSWRKTETGHVTADASPELSTVDLFLRGAIVSITNPHVTVLFVAFLPTFVREEDGQVPLQLVSLGVLFMIAALLVFLVVALASGLVRQKIADSPSTMTKIDRVAAVVYFGLAMKLFFFK